jgi:capsular exopolysaccharide synthesis family protein
LWHPTDYLRVLFKRRWVAAPGFLLVFLTGAIGSIRSVPIYEAQTQLLIEKDARRVTTINTVLDGVEGFENDDFYPTQYKILQSRALALETALALEKTGKPEHEPESSGGFAFSLSGLVGAVSSKVSSAGKTAKAPVAQAAVPVDEPRSQSNKINSILGKLSVVPIPRSRLVDLKFRSPDPEFAAAAANELAAQYILQALRFRTGASKEANDWLTKQLDEQKKKVEESDAALQRYKETHNAVSTDDKQNVVVQAYTTLASQLTQAKIDVFTKEEAYNQVLSLQKEGVAIDALPAIRTNEAVARVKTSITQWEQKDAELAGKNLLPQSPQRLQVADQIKTLNKNLAEEVAKAVGNVRAEFQAAQVKEQSLERDLAQKKTEVTGLERKALEYAVLEREAQGNQTLYKNLSERSKESGVSGEFRGSNIQIVDKAEVPRAPVLPQIKRDLMVAAFGGALLAIALAFGFEYIDSRIKTPDEVKAYLELPCLGMVPVVPIKNQHGETPLLNGEASPAFSEAIRAVRTAVLFASADDGARSIVVTSTGPHEGKTLVASSLAIALAQTGQRTIVMDADMRRPRMHEALGRSQEPGLSNLLVGEAVLTDAVRTTTVQNLWILAAGHIPPNPAELLGSRKYDDLLAELKRRFDWVVIDAPPVMPVTDAALLAHTAGGVLFVIGAEMTPRQSAAAALEQLRSANAKFLGAVLNRVHIERHAYYYSAYYHKAYSKYYQRTPQKA